MGKIIIALALSLSAYADFAKADTTIGLRTGETTVLSDFSTELQASGLTRDSDGTLNVFHVFGCTRGTGGVNIYRPSMENGVYNLRFITSGKWVRNGDMPYHRVATHICDQALNKATK
jgi:hypothetical protein